MFEARDLAVLLRSGAPLVVVETHEEGMLLDAFRHVMAGVRGVFVHGELARAGFQISLEGRGKAVGEERSALARCGKQTLRSAGEEDYVPVLLEMILRPGIDFADLASWPPIGARSWSGNGDD